MRVVAVDWSGRVAGSRRAIWLAEVHDGQLVRLEDGRTREGIGDYLVETARTDRELAVGLDFSFSMPAWFLNARGYATVDELWAAAAKDGDDWLRECTPPFWGRAGTRRPTLPAHLRTTEVSLAPVGGIRPKSTFQVSGAGSVGAGSIRGFPVLARLRAHGFSVWPFDAGAWPLVIEVWPRALTGPVVKSRTETRAAYIDAHLPALDRELRARAVESEDAFDAAVSAFVMAAHVRGLAKLPRADDHTTQLEGRVWLPHEARQASAVSRRATEASTSPGNRSSASDEAIT